MTAEQQVLGSVPRPEDWRIVFKADVTETEANIIDLYRRGVSQAAMARELGLSQQAVSRRITVLVRRGFLERRDG